MPGFRLSRLPVFIVTTAVLVVAIAAAPRAESPTWMVEDIPTPRALAKHLFGPRYRSAAAPGAERFAMRIQFALDSARVLPESRPYLDSVGDMLNLDGVRGQALIIDGHADSRGDEAYNQALSERRAAAVKRYLVERHRIAPARLVTHGHGERRLYDPGDGENPVNRRVEFRAVRNVLVH